MSGNVSEWVWDWFGNYDSENTKGYPMGPAVGINAYCEVGVGIHLIKNRV